MDDTEFWRAGLENFSNFLTPLASTLTALVALYAVCRWKSDRTWERSQELGKRLLLALRAYEHEFENLMDPMHTLGRSFAGLTLPKGSTADDISRASLIAAEADYEAQQKRVNEALAEFRSLLDEAEILWPFGVQQWPETILKLQSELFQFLTFSIWALDPAPDSYRSVVGTRNVSKRREACETLTKDGIKRNSEKTEFQNEWAAAIVQLRERIQDKMR
ncbi:hypothetical protein [Phaeobacter sp. 11ANDIMAR09]|uniref:hypothetical protein n=1 Tax=Phaeobacter sp. 11ANDIMAR09 TaxID=1225647 RepID=UPI0006C8A35C|nr:hypothetical protein [Phaeobacter sp. 11ANDIMAR09]